VGNCFEHVVVFASEAVNVDGIVDGCKRSLSGSFLNFNRTVQAIAELLFEVGDASIGSGEASAESVAVFSRRTYGNNGVIPVGLAEEEVEAEVSLNVEVCAVFRRNLCVFHTVDGRSAEVELKLNTLAEVERVDKTGTECEQSVVTVVVAVALTVGEILFGKSPVAACTCIEGEVVDTAGLVTAEEVGEVGHEVEYRTYFSLVGLYHAIVHVFAEELAGRAGFAATFQNEVVDAETGTPNGSEPFAYIESGVGSETIFEVTNHVVVRNEYVHATLSGDKPVVFERVNQVALSSIFDILDFLSLLGNSGGR